MTPITTQHRGVRTKLDTSVFTRHQLNNGIAVWVQETPLELTEQGTIVAYFINAGRVLDEKGKEHTAHFLEHLPFKGTASFPSTEALSGAVNNAGGFDNATTSQYWTNYRVFLPRESFSLALQVISELLMKPLLRAEDFAVERGIILSEHERKFESTAQHRARMLSSFLYGDHTIARWPGSPESINAITLEDLQAYRKAHYHTGNLQLVVGGAFATIPGLLGLLEAAFADMPHGEPTVLDLPALPALPSGEHQLLDPRFTRTRFHMFWLVPGAVSRESRIALSLLITAFAGGMESPLALELRDKRGLVYESDLMSYSRMLNLGTEIELELPVPHDQFADVRVSAMELLKNISDERIALALDRWQLERLSTFVFPTTMCARVGNELVNENTIDSMHADEAHEDDVDLDLVHHWKDFLTSTPPTIVETGPAA